MRWRSTSRALAFVVGAACTEPQQSEPSYTVVFENSETFSYGGTGCVGNPNTLYCGTWNPDSYEFSGNIRGNPATILVVGGVEFHRPPSAPGLSFSAPSPSSGCHFITLSGQQSNEFSGTFYEATDCHSAGRKGTYHALRSDLPD